MKTNQTPTLSQIAAKGFVAGFISLAVSGYVQAANILQAQILSFEEASTPDWVTADSSQLTSQRAIHGSQSLLWQWQNNQTLTIDHTFERLTDAQATSAYGSAATQVLSFWLYNPVAIDDTLTVALSDSNESEVTTFPVRLNFAGWRTVGISLNLDYPVTQQFDKIRLTAPASSASSGQLYIDRVMVSVDDRRYQWSDDQITTRITVPEIDFGLPATLPAPTRAELDEAEIIRRTLITEFGGNPGSLSSLEDRFSAFGISKDNQGGISGRHILTDKQQVIYQPAHLSFADKTGFDNYVLLGDSDSKGSKLSGYAKLMLDLGKAYHNPGHSAAIRHALPKCTC